MKEMNEAMLDGLRARVSQRMSPKRFYHTAAVEQMICRLCGLYCPEKELVMRSAALLHDITKELKTDEQLLLCRRYGLGVTPIDLLSPKTFHARTAAALIPNEFEEFADPTVIDAERYHTTGRADMTLTEKLLYLADYIDDSRTFESCVTLRNFFFAAEPEKMDSGEKLLHLNKTLLLSFDMTIKDLLEEGRIVAADTVNARNSILSEIANG
ncbi:MAG: HD domain-containing protein [Clostridia bacterium]|nr:HD domain-containing protein [Clostridia bacterium]